MHLLNTETMQAICWTLIHSLWQGLLLAVLAGLVIMLTKKSSSVLRYNLLSVLFFLFVATACATFVWEYNIGSVNNEVVNINVSNGSVGEINNVNVYPINNTAVEKTYIETFTNYFNEHASLIVMIWFVLLSAQFVRLIANAGYVQRIKHYKTHTASNYWNDRMLFLANKLQIKQRVRLLQSEIVKVPMMVGFLKPVILFPFSLMSQLPPEQVEAVLLHELAHIKRKDYFVNLLQSFAEMIFFFNPAVLWLSSVIRDERENCCDDIAIAETKRKNEFIHALVSFQEYNLGSKKYSLAFPGRKNHLLNRVKRIITNNNKTLNNMEKLSLASGIVVIGLMTIAFKQNTSKQEALANKFQAKQIINDTVPDKTKETHSSTFTYKGTIDGKKYELHETNDKVKELYVDGKKIPQDKIADYADDIIKMHKAAKEEQEKLATQNELLEKQQAELNAQQDLINKEQSERNELQDKINGQQDVENLKRAQELTIEKLGVEKRNQEAFEMNHVKGLSSELKEQLKKQNDELMALTNEVMKRQAELKEQMKSLQQKDTKKQAELLNTQILELKNEQLKIQQQRLKINQMLLNSNQNSSGYFEIKPVQPVTVTGIELEPAHLVLHDAVKVKGYRISAVEPVGDNQPEILLDKQPTIVPDNQISFQGYQVVQPIKPFSDNQPISLIIEDLSNEDLIRDVDNFSFTLNDKTLIVNDVKQSEELHEKLKAKYLKGKKDHVIYSKHGNSSHAEVITDSH